MPDFPVIVGHGLKGHEIHLLEYWMEAAAGQRIQKFETLPDRPPDISRLAFFPQAKLREVKELLEWFIPILLVCGSQADIPEEYLQIGVCAIYKLPEPDEPIILPPASLPAILGACFVVSDSTVFRAQLRQILRFAGKQARMDFTSVDDIAQVLAVVDDWPEWILIDVDSERVDIVNLFYRLEKILRDRPLMRARNQMLICKDFSLPGLDLVKLRPILAPHAKRIFHPAEGLLAVIESALFYPGPQPLESFAGPRNMQEILYGDDRGNPGRAFPFGYLKESAKAMRRAIAFQEIVTRLGSERAAGLAIKT